ncbi:MAG: hypothetical protein WBN32_15185 [Woeseia sp.]
MPPNAGQYGCQKSNVYGSWRSLCNINEIRLAGVWFDIENTTPKNRGKKMKGRAAFAAILLVGGVCTLAYMLATGKGLDHEITFIAILAGFIISDQSFWPKRKS